MAALFQFLTNGMTGYRTRLDVVDILVAVGLLPQLFHDHVDLRHLGGVEC